MACGAGLSGVRSVYKNQKELINSDSMAQLMNVTIGDNADFSFSLIGAHLSYNANRYVRPWDAQREEVAGGAEWQHALRRVFFPFLFAHKAGECKQVNKSKDILNSL